MECPCNVAREARGVAPQELGVWRVLCAAQGEGEGRAAAAECPEGTEAPAVRSRAEEGKWGSSDMGRFVGWRDGWWHSHVAYCSRWDGEMEGEL